MLENLLPSSLMWVLAGLGSSQAVGKRTTRASLSIGLPPGSKYMATGFFQGKSSKREREPKTALQCLLYLEVAMAACR